MNNSATNAMYEPTSNIAVVTKYLQDKEWCMGCGGDRGCGQCPECWGVPESWLGHPCVTTPNKVGHRKDCRLALALVALGCFPLFQGECTMPPGEYEQILQDGNVYVSTLVGPEGRKSPFVTGRGYNS